jgi:flagellar motor switch protein FliN/FliY
MTETAQEVQEQTEIAQEKDGAVQAGSKTQVQSVEFSEAGEGEAPNAAGSIDILLDVNITVTVAIGQAEIPVRRLLQLGPGSVLKLDKPVDAPADLYLRGAKFATGNIVVVDDQFAVRIKEILGPSGYSVKATNA